MLRELASNYRKKLLKLKLILARRKKRIKKTYLVVLKSFHYLMTISIAPVAHVKKSFVMKQKNLFIINLALLKLLSNDAKLLYAQMDVMAVS